MPPPTASASHWRIPKWIVPLIAYAAAIASLVWVFRAFDYRQFEQDLRTLHWGWFALGILVNLLVYVVDAWRWAVLLRPAEIVPVGECVKAAFVGQVANAVFPAKAGEIVRCYLLSFWTDTPLSLAITSDAIARVMDGICLVVGFYMLTIGISVPRHLREKYHLWRDGAFILAIAVTILSVLFLFVLFRRDRASSLFTRSKWTARLNHLLHEIHQLGDMRALGRGMLISVLYLFLPCLSVWCLFKAYAFDFSLAAASVVLIIIHMGTILPNAPANIGSFQVFATVALGIMQAEHAAAANFSVLLYFAHTVPQIAAGALVLLFTGLNLGEVHLHARKAGEARHSSEEAQ